ncbi:Lipid A biosynthesis lauroyl acyltransferase [Shimia sp. SK013]|uniref:lysophospholipid acyltransferase family protein n=1 Tax=Shimia sp. SK013 TaxID=1389006 RepID=UPI0006B490C0|nr:lysophospholipid acyltransferase family protein [Shimia sp. SK013]KPA22600.1 Lipid A biosynthesis lauroyl acyltransferase [Shimia sp. SK013]
MSAQKGNLGYKLSDYAIRAFLAAVKVLPYDTRLSMAGWLATNVLAPATGNRQRIRENLALAMPELSEKERESIVRQAPRSMGRMLMETYSDKTFLDRTAKAPISGPGNAVLEQAHTDGKGALLVTGHFGNYLAVRGSFLSRGMPIGVLYKRMSNPYFNDHYVAAMADFGEPMFERSRRGMSHMIKHLRGGGFVGIVHDQRINNAPLYDFMGKPARTAESAAELALKYKVDLVPCYGVRQPDGNYEIVTEAPIPHTTIQEMTKALNESLEAQVRAHPGQWMWTHNRWKNAGNDTSADRDTAAPSAK